MVCVTSVALFTGLLFFVVNEQGYGLPARIRQSNGDLEGEEGLTQAERQHIREILMLAAKELKDKDILQILKKSLILRLKICFSSPLPTSPPYIEVLRRPYGDKRDEEVAPEHGIRSLLEEALERIDEEEILNFLKESLYFRLKFCLHIPHIYPEPGPISRPTTIPSEGPITTPVTASTSKTGTAGPGSSSSTSPTYEPTTTPESTPTTTESSNTGGGGNEALYLPEEALENALATVSRREKILNPHGDDFPRDESTRDDTEIPMTEYDPVLQPAELEGLEMADTPEEKSTELGSDSDEIAKLSESIDAKESVAEEESNEEDDGPIDTVPDKVGNVALQAEKQVTEVLSANSNEGEFDSVITIDYNAVQDEEKKESEGVNLGPIIEPHEELSI